MPTSCQRVVHQYSSGPLSGFILTSAKAGIVHYLSGLIAATSKLLSALHFACFASLQRKSPWSVFQYGSESLGLRSGIFTVSPSKGGFFTILSRYLYAIDLCIYLALEGTTSRFALHNQATLLEPSGVRASEAITHEGPAFQQVCTDRRPLQQCRGTLPLELFRVHSPLLTKSLLVSRPALNDMLKFRA